MIRRTIPKHIRQQVYEKYGGHCAYCGKALEYKEMQVDHLIPLRSGGADNMENYCMEIVGEKSIRQAAEYAQEEVKYIE
ncbi:MAG: HNH endonuclease [Clostridiales bacterium]|nr:HNH endonuclease [Clostridiales bacterium]